jgi:O-antigen ligase
MGGALAAACGLLALTLYAFGVGGTAVAAEGVLRATGPYASPNNLALMLGRLLPAIAAYALWSGGRRRTVYRLAGLPVLLGLVATFSRGALLVGLPVTAAYLGLVALHGADRRRLLWLAACLTALAGLVAPFARTERLAGAFRLRPGGTGFIRLRLWQSAVHMGRDHLLGGVGLDNFLYLYRDRYVRRDAVQERFLNHPHNWLLDWWTRLGAVGLALWLGVLLANLQAGTRGLRRTDEWRILAVAALGMQLYALAHGLVDNHFFLVDLAAAWWLAQAAVLAAAEER